MGDSSFPNQDETKKERGFPNQDEIKKERGFPNQDGFEKEKEKFLKMSLDDKRKHYRSTTFYAVRDISTWQDYFSTSREHLLKQYQDSNTKPSLFKLIFNPRALLHTATEAIRGWLGYKTQVNSWSVDPELNRKVSMWDGNITHLETDAIVNAANSQLRVGGGVDGAIHAAAGDYLKAECATLGGCEVGDAKITGGYRLPAKYVIHTVGPKGEKQDELERCYNKSLDLLIKNGLHTVAFPCISTGIYGYPQDKAAHVALRTVRKYLEKDRKSIERIIFCLFLKEDVKTYENLMQVYFPPEDSHNNVDIPPGNLHNNL